jgi:hypothetical protein
MGALQISVMLQAVGLLTDQLSMCVCMQAVS